MLAYNEALAKDFERVLDSPPPPGRQKEQVVQEFLETHTELIPTPNLLNHHLHFESVISKFPLGTELTTDYVYLTKSSDTWRITFVELEVPEKSIFTSDTKKTNTTAEFNAALNQVRSWKHHLEDNKEEVLRRLEPFLQPIGMRRNPVEFHFQLIIGRSDNKNLTPERKRHFRGLVKESGVEILTYDQLLSYYQNSERYRKLVVRLTGLQYVFKHMHFEPNQMLAYIGPDRLALSQTEFDRLKRAGYEIDKWAKGDLLTFNTKYAESTWKEKAKSGTLPAPLPKV